MVTSCSPGGTAAGAVPEMLLVGANQDAGADFGHDGPCDSIANSCGLYQISDAAGPPDREPAGEVRARSTWGSPSTCWTRQGARILAQWDFSEDTYRTLTAVDSAVMVLDAAPMELEGHRGADPQALRGVPIITFVKKLDRESREPFDLLDEIEQSLALDATPASWPIGMGRDLSEPMTPPSNSLLLNNE